MIELIVFGNTCARVIRETRSPTVQSSSAGSDSGRAAAGVCDSVGQ